MYAQSNLFGDRTRSCVPGHMRAPIFVRPLTEEERARLEAGLRSKDVAVLRRCQLRLARARGEQTSAITRELGRDSQTVRNAIAAFARSGLAALTPGKRGSRRLAPSSMQRSGSGCAPCCTRARPSSARRLASRLEVAAEVSFAEGLAAERVSDETIRTARKRLGPAGSRPGAGSPAPTPSTCEKRRRDRLMRSCGEPPGLGPGLRRRDLVEPAGPAGSAYLDRVRSTAAAARTDGLPRRRSQGIGLL